MLDLTAERDALQRVCDRLRSLPESRMTRPVVTPGGDPGGSIAEAVHELCRWAVAEQGLTHPVPRLHPLASGDQLAVIGANLLDRCVAAPTGREDATLEEWRSRLAALRQIL